MKNKFLAGLFATILSAQAVAQQPTSAPTVLCDDLAAQMKSSDTILVDVRAPADYQKTHITGAVNLPYYSVAAASWPKDANIVLYCSGIGCSLSHDSAITMMKLGYANVRTLYGGIAEWGRKGYPIVSAPQTLATTNPLAGRKDLIFMTTDVGATDADAQIKKGAKLAVLDVRPATEYMAGHLPGARNIPLELLDKRLSDYAPGSEVLVCDRIADRAAQARDELWGAGVAAHVLTGGISVWAASGKPLAVGANDR